MKSALKILIVCMAVAAPILYWFLAPGIAEGGAYELLRHKEVAAKVKAVGVPLDKLQDEKLGVVLKDGVLFFPENENKYPNYFDLSLDTRQYNTLHLKLRANKDTACRLNWSTDIAPDLKFNHGILIEVKAGDTFQDYAVSLPQEDGLWSGKTSQMQFNSFYATPAQVELQSMSFEFKDDPAPQRYTAKGKEHKTMPATPYPPDAWSFQVPPNAQLQTAVAFGNLGWKPYQSNGAVVSISLKAEGEESLTLFEQKLDPVANESDRTWKNITADLSRFAGNKVEIRFMLDNLEDTTGDFVFWKEPIAFTKGSFTENTPVFLISLDTVRADHMSVYGYGRDTAPFMTELARNDAVVFENAYTLEPWTLTAHMSMLTGLYPKHHGVTPENPLSEDIKTLPEILQEEGYLTLAQTSISWWLGAKYGFSQGFDNYLSPAPYQNGYRTTEQAITLLQQVNTNKFFMFLHNFDAHGKVDSMGYDLPYQPEDPNLAPFSSQFTNPPTFEREGLGKLKASQFLIATRQKGVQATEEELAYMLALYDDSILNVDKNVETFIEKLKERGMYDDALIIITSDHGEGFNEHGYFLHEGAYQDCIHVPMMIKFPGNQFAGQRISSPVQLVDILPTVLGVLNVKPTANVDGQNLHGLLSGTSSPAQYAYSFKYHFHAIMTKNWKLLFNAKANTYELFDLAKDPTEQINLIADTSPMADELKRKLMEFMETDKIGDVPDKKPKETKILTDKEVQELEALGYLN